LAFYQCKLEPFSDIRLKGANWNVLFDIHGRLIEIFVSNLLNSVNTILYHSNTRKCFL